MFEKLKLINQRPDVWARYTAALLWTDEHTSEQMLQFHLNPEVDISSRRIEFIDRSVAWMKDRFGIGADTTVCDFGCGPGLYTSRFAEFGAEVTGIDFSARSIDYARSQAEKASLPINYLNQDYLQFESETRFNLITLLMCDFCALSPQQRAQLLGRFHRLLEDDGHVVLDVYSLAGFAQREEVTTYAHNLLNGFWAAEEYYGFLNTFLYAEERVALDKYALFTQGREWEVYNWLQYFSPEALRKEVELAGFTIADIYADVAGGEYDESKSEFAVVLMKQ
jgi:SAM-dependent methyltransferase